MKRINITCPACGSRAYLRPASVVYGDRAPDPDAKYYREGCKVNFKNLLLRAKDGDQQAKEEIFLMYRPLLFKESCVNGLFDEDLFQELSATLIHCIRMFKL